MTITATRTSGVRVFLLLSFGLAWAGMIGAAVLGFSTANPLVQLPFAFAPAIAALVVRWRGEGFADAGLRLLFRQAWWHYLLAWLAPFAFAAASMGVAVLLGFTLEPVPWWLYAVLLAGVPLLTPVYWGEEFGWTSYLRLRLFPDRPTTSTLATGLVWAVWHYPLAFTGYVEFDNVVLGLAVWTVSFLCQEVLLSWLRLASGTVWTASLAHAGNNMVLSLLLGAMLPGVDALAVTVVLTVPMAIVAGWLLVTGRTGERRPAGARRAAVASRAR
ncbi:MULTISPECIES: CPBP family glutamic-type intramembrane protease [unclassified Saccharothrix]|uniref:CPBP family glutamic-type intramembrane protease n=1 Tax=unclassified Saccharothrix TaxID=2593673 RepID=UPI00307F7D7A